MRKISAAHLKYFRNDGHFEFMVTYGRLLARYPAAMAAVAALYGEFTPLLLLEESLINDMRKSDLTERIAEADHRVDRAIIGMRGVIASAMHHFDPGMVMAAKKLYNRFEAFGAITKKTYEEETADVNLLIKDLNVLPYYSPVQLLGLLPWLSELSEAEREFEELLAQRVVERAQKPQGRLKDVRCEIDAVYHKMIDRLEAANTMDGGATYASFIAELNVQIAYFNDHAHQHARRDISVGDDCVIEPIDVQKYSGKAITPVPRAYYRGGEGKPTVELVFAKDFSLTYKNNVEVGMAEVTLTGKGAYKGRRSTTFNIAR
jgi:hypothetical protein